jgi:hypothetical protein
MFAHTSEQRPQGHPEVDGDGVGNGYGNGRDKDIDELVWMMGEGGKGAYEGRGGKRTVAYIRRKRFRTGTTEDTKTSRREQEMKNV